MGKSSVADVFVYGAGGLGSLATDILLQDRRYRPVAALDSEPARHGADLDGIPIIGGLEQVDALTKRGVGLGLVAIGFNPERVRIADELLCRGVRLISAIHPLASIAQSASLGPHVIIGARATVCVHARIQRDCVISAAAIIEHDNHLARGVFVHPAAKLAGGVTVDELATIGIGACVIPGRRIGRSARIEPGAVVIRDVIPGETVSGIPAQPSHPSKPRFQPNPVDLPQRAAAVK
ncbi:MAG: NeuD/PglB/VioB family sugar acetyltransferase [Phycisphaerales bacterium]|nr:NeuD/PglB/VioB family sugar acetyltransferase [Phycisphaerales bacterium]